MLLASRRSGRNSNPGWFAQLDWHRLPTKEIPLGTKNVVLTDAQTELVERLVSSGRFQNVSEALRAGLRLLEREETELTQLRARIAAGIDQVRNADLAEGDGEEAIRRAFRTARDRR